jgi:ATP-binding cassette subfamily F protein 3
MLFRDDHVKKKISVLSGGERARLCMAGLLLGSYNVLVLDEPGNHLDVETVEALAEALLKYKGTVIFTSHDRHFMKRIATSIVEVRDGCARNYIGDYEAYLYAINQEIDAGEREYRKTHPPKALPAAGRSGVERQAENHRDERAIQKQLKTIERKIAKLDDEKREFEQKLLVETDPQTAMELHEKVKSLSDELKMAEEQWLKLSGH